MSSEKNVVQCKVVLVGNSGVGKTCINNRFIKGTYSGNEVPNSAASFSSKNITIDEYSEKTIKFEVWDTAWQEQYRSMGKIFYKGAGAAILVYEITNKNSFEDIQKYWYSQVKEYGLKDINNYYFYLIFFLLS